MQNFDPFVLPFSVGVFIILVLFVVKIYKWIAALTVSDRYKIIKGLASAKVFSASIEVIRESLLHRNIFRQNPVLGYMHASLAFGWFMLIAIGNLESRIHAGTEINPFWFPIFFDFFVVDKSGIPFEQVFTFLMDFFLLIVLSGVALAAIKRFKPQMFGMKSTSKLSPGDSFALYSLWLIFPLRLFAESFTAGIYNSGGFLTGTIGSAASSLFNPELPAYISWWAYSVALGVFFTALPFSRYLHIPAEVILIYFRKFGVSAYNSFNGFAQLEVDSCSRCGICIDKCQINFVNNKLGVAPAYFLKGVRYNKPVEEDAFSCLLCGRCSEACPVGIGLDNIRLTTRKKILEDSGIINFNYLPAKSIEGAKVAYFAGCMSHLTPSIIKSMKTIFNSTGTEWTFIDEGGGACCGRPLKLAGEFDGAAALIAYNKNLIKKSKAELLVTSCPICLKIFKEDYNLNVRILHHSQFIDEALNKGSLSLDGKMESEVVYHDPCELGRGLGIYSEPRSVLSKFATVIDGDYSGKSSLCCGGSLANTNLGETERNKIIADAVAKLTVNNPSKLITACPLCKKTFERFSDVKVEDIAEIVGSHIAAV